MAGPVTPHIPGIPTEHGYARPDPNAPIVEKAAVVLRGRVRPTRKSFMKASYSMTVEQVYRRNASSDTVWTSGPSTPLTDDERSRMRRVDLDKVHGDPATRYGRRRK